MKYICEHFDFQTLYLFLCNCKPKPSLSVKNILFFTLFAALLFVNAHSVRAESGRAKPDAPAENASQINAVPQTGQDKDLVNYWSLWGTIFSGIASLLALIISVKAFNRESKFAEATFWLQLREIFNSPDRRRVHLDLREAKWKNSAPARSEVEEWAKIEEYMGLFEVCEGLLAKKILNQETFVRLYEYRLFNLCKNHEIIKRKLVCEHYDWELFYQLLSRIYGTHWYELFEFLKNKKFAINEVEVEQDLINILNKIERDRYFQHRDTCLESINSRNA